MVLKDIIKKIKEKKQLSYLDEELVRNQIDRILEKNKKIRDRIDTAKEFKEIEKSKELKQIVKEARNELNRVYGVFQTKEQKELSEKFEKLKQEKTEEKHKEILSAHLSSKERLNLYPVFYEKIFEITGKPNSILDIACGLNPFSFRFMNLEGVKYYAIDFNSFETKLVERYFKMMNLDGEAITQDITKDQRFPKAELCLAFKIFDLIEPKITEKIIDNLKCNYLAASFSKTTVKQQKMKQIRRAGFQKMLRRLNLNYKVLDFPNEIVYIIRLSRL